jgi:hypothetical protein
MRSYEVGSSPTDRDAAHGWEVAQLDGGTSLDGVWMAGFRDRIAGGLDLQVLPQPAVIVVIALGDDPLTVEGPAGLQPLNSLVAALSPGSARIRGKRVECIEMRLSPRAAYELLGVSPYDLDRSITALENLCGRHEERLRSSWGRPRPGRNAWR